MPNAAPPNAVSEPQASNSAAVGSRQDFRAGTRSFAIELYCDAALENQIVKAWNILARRGISSTLIDKGARPSLRVSLHSELDPAKLRTALENLSQQQQPVSISLAALGSFGGPSPSLFFCATPSTALLTLHSNLHELLKRLGVPSDPAYQPGAWLPHCLAAEGVPPTAIGDAFGALRAMRLPLSGHLCEVGVVECQPALREHLCITLGGEYF